MLINEVAKITGLSVHAIRYYEHEGLLDGRHVTRQSNGYREYNNMAIERLQLLQQARATGFSMAEIKNLAKAYDAGTLTIDQQRDLLAAKIDELSQKIAAMQTMKATFEEKLHRLRHNN